MPQRILDPDYLNAYREELRTRLEWVTEQTEQLRSGNELGVEPGFGLLDSSQEARRLYAEAHEKTWENLQRLRADLHGAIVTIDQSLALHAESEEINVTDLSAGQDDISG